MSIIRFSNVSMPALPSPLSDICAVTKLPYLVGSRILSSEIASCWREVNKAEKMISACPFVKELWEDIYTPRRLETLNLDLLRLCQIDPSPHPSLQGRNFVVRTAALRFDFVSPSPI